MEPAVPPLGVSMRESIEAGDEAPRDAGVVTLARVNDCEIPPYIANDAAGPSVFEDLAYGDDKKQKYDLVLPENRGAQRSDSSDGGVGGAAPDHERDANVEEELGDALFALVNLARHLDIDAEGALRRTIDKFTTRFSHVEERVKENHGGFGEAGKLPLETLDAYWEEAKAKPR